MSEAMKIATRIPEHTIRERLCSRTLMMIFVNLTYCYFGCCRCHCGYCYCYCHCYSHCDDSDYYYGKS